MKYTYSMLKELFESKGAKLISEEYKNASTPVKFSCSCCGKVSQIKMNNYNSGKNQNLLCTDCARKRQGNLVRVKKQESEALIKEEFASKGSELISTYINAHTPLVFKCSRCGKKHSITWDAYKRGNNKNLLCKECLTSDFPSLSKIKEEFESKGASLVSSSYINNKQKLEFICSKCGVNHHFITYSAFKSGNNKNLLCPDCQHNRSSMISLIKEEFESKGAKLISSNFVKSKYPLDFLCSRCGKLYHIEWHNYINGSNPYLLCDSCLRGLNSNPDGSSGHTRSLVDSLWYRLIKDFFNIEDFSLYSSHHIKKYSQFPEFRTSIFNGYPLLKSLHEKNSKFYHYGDGVEISSWSGEEKLPYHNYDNFSFLDFNKNFITEIIYPKESYSKNYFLEKKLNYSKKGIDFIPIYFSELLGLKREIIFSMLKIRAAKIYPSIFKYTNTVLTYYNGRCLKIEEISSEVARVFLDNNHIQGFVGGKVYLGLYQDDLLVMVMSFGKDRNHKYEWELLRLASLKNSIVRGGASKLFKYFINKYKPKELISFCDMRFSSLSPEDTIYRKLGFEFIGYTLPNYKYIDPETYALLSRNSFQKYKLKTKLDKYDENLSEEMNMLNNGYIKQYDCGNMKFLWRK